MDQTERIAEALEVIAAELQRLRVLQEYEMDVRVEEAEGGHGPYVVVEDEELEPTGPGS